MNDPVRYRLENGLTVVLQPSTMAKVVAFQAWVDVGSADEPPELAGIAHVFEHMLFKGTERRGVGQIAQEVEAAGGEINAWTSFDQTVYHLVLASRFFDTGLDILGDALFHSSFDPGELERELKVVLEEVKQGEDNPSRVVTQALFASAYQKHPYRRPVIGSSRTVKTFTRERLLDFFHKHYVAPNITLVVVGDFDVTTAKKKIAAIFGSAPGHHPPPGPERSEPAQRATRTVVVQQDVREAQLTMAFHIPPLKHEDTAALDVASILLGQGDSSRLAVQVKRAQQSVNEAWAYAYTPRDPGLFVVGATLPWAKLDEALAALGEQTFRLAHDEVSAVELEKAQAIIAADAIYQKETVQGQARKLGFFETVTGDLGYEAAYHAAVRTVTPSRIREVAARWLKPENATVAVLAPKNESARDLEARLNAGLEHASSGAAERFAARAAAAAGKASAATSPEAKQVKLPSGVRLIVMREPSVGLVAMRAVWVGGLRYEDEKWNGVNNLIAGLMTRGTRTRSGDELAHEVEAMAGSIGGFSGKNSFGMRAEMLAVSWERGLEILADSILQPAFAEEEVEKERRHILEELRNQEDNIAGEAFRLFHQTLYKKHPYRLDVLGTQASVSALSRRRLLDYYRRNMAVSGMTLAVVGDVNPDAVIQKARALFGGKKVAEDAKPTPPQRETVSDGPHQVFRFQNKQQAHVVYGFPGCDLRDKDRFALEVLATILSGQGGRLFLELRDKRGLAYRVSAHAVEGIDPGYFAVYIATSPQNLEVAVSGIQDELSRMAATPPPAAELDRAKRYLVGAHEISLQRRASLASTIAFNACYGLGWDEYTRYAPSILAVTAEDVQRVARRFLDPKRAVVATIKPEEQAPALAKPKAAASKAARAQARKR
jgi:zinc protease